MNIHKNFDLVEILWYKIGGQVPFVLDCFNQEDIVEAISFIEKNHIQRTFVIGLGANILFNAKNFDGAIIRMLNTYPQDMSVQDSTLTSFAGEILNTVILQSFREKLTGLEWAGGLPGTVGAAIRGNVGAFGGEIKDSLLSAEVLTIKDSSTDLVTLSSEDLKFSYRHSSIKENRNLIVTSATFQLHHSTDDEIHTAKEIYHKNIAYREKNHPLEYPNCGSVFKNIKDKSQVEKILEKWPDIAEKAQTDWHGKVSMGYAIKRLGFSGLTIGGAQVSEKHANFIVNKGTAQFEDVFTIITQIKEKFGEEFGFQPEVEIEIVE
jgi:UDP-N-acetylmuramate dehydrogenase